MQAKIKRTITFFQLPDFELPLTLVRGMEYFLKPGAKAPGQYNVALSLTAMVFSPTSSLSLLYESPKFN